MVSFLFILLETTLFLLLLPPSDIYAQVVINEFSSSDSSDWIELFNTSVGEIDLTSWSIKDTAASPVYDFSGNRLPAKESCYQDVSNRLNNSGDRIQLLSGVTEVDCVTYGTGNGSFCADAVEADITAPSTGETAARTPEGTGTWVIGFQTKSITSCESLIS
ncbi:MAG TPA: lamin tail domain-containing protein, partial [Candidatus Hodarchaeales archaeon]|nr:lamin tail domain-containing protein [Candidatus Hodarchaeales archaeon]